LPFTVRDVERVGCKRNGDDKDIHDTAGIVLHSRLRESLKRIRPIITANGNISVQATCVCLHRFEMKTCDQE